MAHPTRSLATLVCVGAMVVSAPALSVTYDYTGTVYSGTDGFRNDATPTGSYSTNQFISGSFSVAAALVGNLVNTSVSGSLTDWYFNDGRNTISFGATLASVNRFVVWTDAAGNITGWDIEVVRDYDPSTQVVGAQEWLIRTCSMCGSSSTPLDRVRIREVVTVGQPAGVDTAQSKNLGEWTTAAVPEPGTLALLGLGLLGLGFTRRRKAA